MSRRRVWRATALAGVALLLSGCGFTGLYGTALPGATAGRGGYEVTAVFDDALELVPQAAVKVADVTVGTVREVRLSEDRRAEVVMGLEDDVDLPANATAVIQQTSLLGEKFVELAEPAEGAAQERLRDGARIDASRTTTYPDLEQVFGALSLVLNGGSLERIQTISYEIAQALSGREGKVRDLLAQLDTFVGGLDKQKSDVVRAIEAMDRLAGTLAAQRSTINRALTDLAPGLKVLSDNRAELTKMLTALSDLGKVGTRIINASAANTAASLRDLQPILQRIQAAGASLPRSLEVLFDYPFPRAATDGIPGDYTSLYVTVLLQQSICNPLPVCPIAGGTGSQASSGGAGATAPTPQLPGLSSPAPDLSPLPVPLPLPGDLVDSLTGLSSLIGGALR